MQFTRHISLGFAFVALSLVTASSTYAQTIITGHYDSHTSGNGIGYDAQAGSFVVPVDTGGNPSATFNNNSFLGLNAYNDTVVVNGGQFNNNGSDGLYVFAATANVNGGQFSNNGTYGLIFTSSTNNTARGTVRGGSFNNNYVALDAENGATVTVSGGSFTSNRLSAITTYTGSNVVVTGGQFSGNSKDFYASNGNTTDYPVGTIDLFGIFNNPVTGQAMTLGQTYSLSGIGSFTGTLYNNLVSQTYTYNNNNATITLHDVGLVPEPTQYVTFCLGVFGLGTLAFRTRRRVV